MSGPGYTFDDGQPENPAASYTFDDGKPENHASDSGSTETAGRVAGLAGRALMQGAGQLADLPGHLIAGTDYIGKTIADTVRHLFGFGSSMPAAQIGSPVTAAATHAADSAGLPRPVTPVERIGSAAVQALPSVALAGPEAFAAALPTMASGAASQGVAEAGGGPVAQFAAGLLAPTAPTAGTALVRGLTRGGSVGAEAAAQRLAEAQAAGVNLTAGQATGSRTLQALEGTSSKLWGGAPIRRAADAQTEALGDRVNGIVDGLSPNAAPSPTTAGEAIATGVANAKQTMRAAEKAAYDRVDQLVPGSTPVDASASAQRAQHLVNPTANPELNAVLVHPKLAAFADALGSGQMSYADVKALRSAVGAEITPLATDSSNGAFKQLYGQLTDDLTNGAAAVSPEAANATKAAGALYKANQAKRDFLDSVVNKAGGPEAIYQAALSGTKLGATKISGVMSALGPEEANTVRATVLDRLGRAIPSQQDAAGSAFNLETYLTRWSQLSPEAKDALFGSSGQSGQLRSALDSIANTMSTVRSSTLFRNPSGTGATAAHEFGLIGILKHVAEVGGGIALGHGATVASAGGALALAGGSVGLNNLLARALANPRVATWLASSTKLPVSALPAAVSQLSRLNDPTARTLAAAIQQYGGAQ